MSQLFLTCCYPEMIFPEGGGVGGAVITGINIRSGKPNIMVWCRAAASGISVFFAQQKKEEQLTGGIPAVRDPVFCYLN